MKRNLKARAEKLNFRVNTQDIAHDYWRANKDKVKKAITFLKTVMLPYCKRHGHYISKDLNCHYGDKKNKSKETKNYWYGLYKTKHDMEVFCHNSATYIDLFILLPVTDFAVPKTILLTVTLYSKYSDDEYTEARAEAVKKVLDHIQKGRKVFHHDGFGDHIHYTGVMLWNDAAVKRDKEKVTLNTQIDMTSEYGDLHRNWDELLFFLSCDRHYLDD